MPHHRLHISLYIFVFILLIPSLSLAALEDPTRPPGSRSSTPNGSHHVQQRKWVLTSTLISRERRIATINGKIVVPGDMINGARVIEILPALVTLRSEQRKIRINLLSGKIKELSKNHKQH